MSAATDTHFFELAFAPLPHSSSSTLDFRASASACFAAAASALRALPATFLVFSTPFLPAMVMVVVPGAGNRPKLDGGLLYCTSPAAGGWMTQPEKCYSDTVTHKTVFMYSS